MGVSLDGIDAALIQAGLMRGGSDLSTQDTARNTWLRGHIVAMARLVEDGGVSLEWSAETELAQLLDALHQVMDMETRILEDISELLGLLDEVESLEEDQVGRPVAAPTTSDMQAGEQAAWLSRLCAAFVRAEEVFPWRVGESPSERQPDFLVGAPPPTPPLIGHD